MLIDFKVRNFASFRNEAELSMVAAPITEYQQENTARYGTLELLKSAVIYGANASGKSNLIRAMEFFCQFVLNSAKNLPASEKIPVEIFKLSTKAENEPAFFEMRFIIDDRVCRYGFQVTPGEVLAEWLYLRSRPSSKEAMLFTRDHQEISLGNKFGPGRDLVKLTRSNSLFLSVASQFNVQIAMDITRWLHRGFNVLSGLQNEYKLYTRRRLADDPAFKERILQLLKMGDFGISDLSITKTPIDQEHVPAIVKESLNRYIHKTELTFERIDIRTRHTQYNDRHKPAGEVLFDLEREESHGTQQLFALAGPIIDTLEKGKTLVIDEMDSRLHPQLLSLLVKLLHSLRYNRNNAQLLFVTQNSRLLSESLFRRDQIWFTNKNKFGESELFSLYEFKEDGEKIRKDEAFEKNYLLGKYGAVPQLIELDLFDQGE